MTLNYNRRIIEKIKDLPKEQREIAERALELAEVTNEQNIKKILYKELQKKIND